MGKKILVTSIPCWNQKTGSDTWPSILRFLNPTDVANIYIDAGIPDSPVASRYFNINESRVIKSIFKDIKTGKEFIPFLKHTNEEIIECELDNHRFIKKLLSR